MMRFTLVDPATGLPCLKGPWGELVAISTQSGDILWRTPIGTYPALADHPVAGGWGTILSGGPIMTAAGLTIVASRADAGLHVLDSTTGQLLRTLPLPAGAHATPMSYLHNEKQYVAIALGGEALADGKPGDYIVAFALDQ